MRTQERMQFRQIAAELDRGVKNVYQAWQRGVADLAKQAADAHGEYLADQLANLESAINSLMPKVIQGDVRVVQGPSLCTRGWSRCRAAAA